MKYLKYAVRIIFFLVISFFVFVFLFSSLLHTWTRGGQFVTQPSDGILATAEYLYLNPNPTPYDFTVEWYRYSPDKRLFCTTLYGGTYIWTRLFLNGEQVPKEYLDQPLWLTTYRQFEPTTIFCLHPDDEHTLSEGLHLLEIQYKSSPFDSGITYQWAIKIEAPTPTPTPNP